MSEPAFEKFYCAPGLKLQAHERVVDIQLANLVTRLDRVEEMIERLEKRLWLMVYGIVAVILSQVMQSVLAIAP